MNVATESELLLANLDSSVIGSKADGVGAAIYIPQVRQVVHIDEDRTVLYLCLLRRDFCRCSR